MKNYFYYKKYETPIPYIDRITNKPYEKTGKIVCDHPLVEKAWLFGGLSMEENSKPIMFSVIIMKDGSRMEFKDEDDQYSKVNEYLSNLNK